jgi:oligopeptide/dipeptide ABC transporter ATP-binding protein
MTAPKAPVASPSARAGNGATALLSLEDLRVYFHTKRGIAHAVDGVSFEIGDGEALGLVGETGSGKTVTARSLIRLIPVPPGIYAGGRARFHPTTVCPSCSGVGCPACRNGGRVSEPCRTCKGAGCESCSQSGLRTVDLLTISDRQMRRIRGNHISMVFQDPDKALNPSLSVRRQLAEVFALHRSDELLRAAGIDGASSNPLLMRDVHGRSTFPERTLLRLPPLRARHRRLAAELDDRIAGVLADTRIANPRKVMKSYPHELSGGMKQRVMIAQALACDPDLLIADEPTTSLDVTIQARILDLIVELQDRHHASVLYISHDLAVVRSISDRVAVMYAGQLVEIGPTARILSDPLHPYTRGLLAARAQSDRPRGQLKAITGTVPELIDPPPSCRFHTRCPHAAPICRREEPALAVHDSPDHRVACFLYHDAVRVGVPASDMPVEGTP